MAGKYNIILTTSLIAILVGNISYAAPADNNFTTYLNLALQHDADIRAELARVHAVEEGISHALGAVKPTVKFTASVAGGSDVVTGGTSLEDELLRSSIPRSSYSISVDEMIYRGGQTHAELFSAISKYRAEVMKLESTVDDDLVQAATDFLDVLRDQQLVELAQQYYSLAGALRIGEEKRKNMGQASNLEIAEADAAVSNAYAELLQNRIRLAASIQSFVKDVGVEPGILTSPKLIYMPQCANSNVESAVDDNPDVLYAKYNVAAAEYDVKVARAEGRPTVDLAGQYRKVDGAVFPAEEEQASSITLNINIPLYSGGIVSSDVRNKIAIRDQLRQTVIQAHDVARAQALTGLAQASLGDMETAELAKQITADLEVERGEKALRIGGLKTLTDIISAEKSTNQARAQIIQTQHDAMLARITTLRALGCFSKAALNMNGSEPALERSNFQLILRGLGVPVASDVP